MYVLENVDSSEDEIIRIANNIHNNLLAHLIETPMTPSEKHKHMNCLKIVDYWSTCIDKIGQLLTMSDVKKLILDFYATNNICNFSRYNIGQGLMKATTHLLWKKL